jgi:hypothetical protein
VKIAVVEAFARWRMENLHEKAVGKQSINKPIEDLIFSIFMLEISFSSGKIQNKL